MCKICDDWSNDLLTPEEAYDKIKTELKDEKDLKEVRHLLELSDRILDEDLNVNWTTGDD